MTRINMPDLSHFLTHLTTAPGIYRMLDAEGNVLYVGKARNLKKRVNSYFNKQTGAKTRSLVSQIVSIDVSVTRTETEALLLESTLIKSLRPKYNVLMRDDKSYPYIYINSQHAFPRMVILRSKKKPKDGHFFGPYPSATAVKETLIIIQKLFNIRHCSDSFFSARTRPCLQYQIKRCTAPCTGFISKDDYAQSVTDAIQFLQGKSQLILDDLAKRMQEAVSILAFEEAARLRDQIKQVRLVQEQQSIVQPRGDADVIAVDAKPGLACIQCVSIRDGEVLSSQAFFPSVPKQWIETNTSSAPLWQAVFSAFIRYYYIETPERIPALIITHHALEEQSDLEALLSELRGKRCQIQTRPRGVNARWLDFTMNNLKQSLAEQQTSVSLTQARYQALQEYLQLPHPIQRMECFDISHTQGIASIASCVVFDEKGPSKKDYRRFNITGITPGDDYAAMEQALTRRYKRLIDENQPLPDIIIIDGGKGQISIARRVLAQLNLTHLYLLGIAKGPERKAGWEKLILVNDHDEHMLPPDSPALHLLQQIRDEAHRFAITAHRKKRQKSSFQSSLESIEGIGASRRQALLKRFGGIRELAKAPMDELIKVPGISARLALKIYDHFHDD